MILILTVWKSIAKQTSKNKKSKCNNMEYGVLVIMDPSAGPA